MCESIVGPFSLSLSLSLSLSPPFRLGTFSLAARELLAEAPQPSGDLFRIPLSLFSLLWSPEKSRCELTHTPKKVFSRWFNVLR
jgi:hypothetical protein